MGDLLPQGEGPSTRGRGLAENPGSRGPSAHARYKEASPSKIAGEARQEKLAEAG